ncbi:hypothetical protein [Bacillus marinisedimentorum]|uniref:hypothetical protein n=1 Tax=Bacillus marinisedimentorum TaxID=1821260 RepID=UPI00087206A2|nr:hypothetical protein [Bacillus marinisedimentorum]
MGSEIHYFQMENQYNAVHFPERPNGFAVLVIGDANHYVEKGASLWTQHFARRYWIEEFVKEGYIVFYSNLFGPNWGSPKSVEYLHSLWQLLLRKYILNNRLHVAADGMGALSALKLMKKYPRMVRSAVFIDPCLDLKHHFHKEKSNRLFFHRMLHDLSAAYEVKSEHVEENVIAAYRMEDYVTNHPVRIWHATDLHIYDITGNSRQFEKLREESGNPIKLTLYVQEKKYTCASDIKPFFKENEKIL